MALLFCCYEKFSVWHSRVYWLNKYLTQLLCFRCSLSGVSPFQGETVEETCRRITDVKYEFNSKHFDPISQQAKDFITALLVKNPKWVKAHFLPFFFTFSLESSPHYWSVGSTVRKFMQKFHESASSNFHSRSQSFDSFCQRQGSIADADQKDRSPGNENVKFLRWRGPHWLEEFMTKLDSDTSGRSGNLVPRVFVLSRRNPASSPVHARAFW